MRHLLKTLLAATAAIGLSATASVAEGPVTLRIQNHQAPESTVGKLIAKFVEDVETMSGGEIDIEMFYSSSPLSNPSRPSTRRPPAFSTAT